MKEKREELEGVHSLDIVNVTDIFLGVIYTECIFYKLGVDEKLSPLSKGISVCSLKDPYQKNISSTISYGRALKAYNLKHSLSKIRDNIIPDKYNIIRRVTRLEYKELLELYSANNFPDLSNLIKEDYKDFFKKMNISQSPNGDTILVEGFVYSNTPLMICKNNGHVYKAEFISTP